MPTESPLQRRLFVSMLVSVDGFIEGPNAELDWFLDGDPAFERYCDEMIDSVGVAVYGRRSYELMLSYWPDAERRARTPAELAFARKMNALPKVVVSSTLMRAEWSNTTVIGEDVPSAVRQMKQSPGKPIVVWGGAALVHTLAQHDLIDEYRLLVQPALLGNGTPLFKDRSKVEKLHLVRTSQLGTSIAVLCYEPERA